MDTALRLGLFILTLLAASADAEDFYAAQINTANQHRLLPGGIDAIGGLGDWLLSDGNICAVISGANHASFLSAQGGALVDLWHCDAANDQWSVSHTQLNLQKEQIPPTDAISSAVVDGAAWIEISGRRDGILSTVRYQLSAAHPGELLIESSVSRFADGPTLGMFGAIILHPGASLRPFTIDSHDHEQSRGFDLQEMDTTKPASILSSVSSSNTQVLIGSRHIEPSISYGVRLLEALLIDAHGETHPVSQFMLGGREFSLFGAFIRPFPDFWPRTPGMVSFALGQVRDLHAQETFVFRQSISVNRRADAAVVTDTLYTGATVTGTVDTHQAGLTVHGADGKPVTFVRPAADGSFSFRLPQTVQGFSISIETPWGESRLTHTPESVVTNTAQRPANIDLGQIDLGTPGEIRLPRERAMSLTFLRGDKATLLNSELSTLTIDERRLLGGSASHRLSLAGSHTDLRKVQLAPGSYRVIASRGPEYSVTETQIELRAGEVLELNIGDPARIVDSTGLIGVDLHVHSAASFDSSLPVEQRVRDFVAQGAEVLVPTEHNVTYDIAPVVQAMGLEDAVLTFPGVEITGMARSSAAPTTIGHSNVFPVEVMAGEFMGGTLPFESRRLGQVIAQYKSAFPNSIFQLNHPRSEMHDEDIAFFNHLSQGAAYDPTAAVTEGANRSLIEPLPGSNYRDIDFDAIELLNGPSMSLYRLVRQDWFSLLKQNFYKVATANSDSHSSHKVVAFPRNYVSVANDDPAQARVEDVVSAVKRGALYGSTGPIIRVDLDGAGPGETLSGNSATLTISVDRAPWIAANTVDVWLNGELWQTLAINGKSELSLDVTVARDSFVFVEVHGEPGAIYRRLLPGFTPFAFANPVFMDVAGDGWHYADTAK